MFKNHIKLAFRNLFRQKLYSLINILGLAVAIASCLFILIYVTDELSFDRFHSNAENTYRVRHQYFMGDQDYDWPETSPLLAEVMRNQFPEVESVTSIAAPVEYSFRHKNDLFGGIKTLQADSNFFKVFDFPLREGDMTSIMSAPNSIVISKDVAYQFFAQEIKNEGGFKGVVGKTLTSNGEPYAIAGIIDNVPENSHLQFDVVVSIYPRLQNAYLRTTWLPAGIHHYAVLKENISLKSLEEKFTAVEKAHLWPEMQQHLGASINRLEDNTLKYGYSLEPLLDIHLVREGNLKYVYAFTTIGLLIIILGTINFINLYTARTANKAKEVGVRKVLGSDKVSLMSQFFTEAFLMCSLATFLAVILVQIFYPAFNQLAGKSIHISSWYQLEYMLFLLAFLFIISFASGIYPALILASFKPTAVLKGVGISTKGGSNLRNSFIVFQFLISIVLIISSLGLFNHVEFMQTKDPGFNKERVLVISDAYSLKGNGEAFKNQILQHPAVEGVSFSYAIPSSTFDWLSLYKKPGDDKEHQFLLMETDHDFVETYGLSLIDGRDFSKIYPSDSSAILLNESAAKQLGINGLLGLVLTDHFNRKFKIIGIIEDFNFEHLKNEVKPLAIKLNGRESFSMFVSVKLNTSTTETIQFIEKQWRANNDEAPFNYSFLDDKFNAQFKTEVRTGNIMVVFTGLAIFIACLGLFGMATFTAEQRTKEIGIRKVLGASVGKITLLLSKEFIKPILIAFVVAVPLSWHLLQQWLQNFAHRADIGLNIFLLSGILVVVIALLTVSYQSIKAALANPVDSLRNE